MKIEYIKGNLLTSNESVIAHGCNAQGAFASGFAGALRKTQPFAYEAYMQAHRDNRLNLGSIIWARSDRLIVANIISQERYGREPRQYVSYEAIKTAMETLNRAGKSGINLSGTELTFQRAAMPMIGAGLGGGDWSVIEQIIETACKDVQPVVYVIE